LVLTAQLSFQVKTDVRRGFAGNGQDLRRPQVDEIDLGVDRLVGVVPDPSALQTSVWPRRSM